jgi:hypothetical protein
MNQNIPMKSHTLPLTNDMILKYGSIISAAIFGSIIIGYLIYLLFTSVGSGKSKFKGYSSLDSLYDDAGGNDPLSNARLTSDINISSDTQSCKYQVIYEGNETRKVNCIQGCEGNDDKAKFCKKYQYPEGDLGLENPLLDQTFVDRKESSGEGN